MALEEIQDQNGAFDVPDVNDLKLEHLFGAVGIETALPDSVLLNPTPSHNQGKSWHCTSYALTHIEEILNTLEHHQSVELDPEEQWANQKANRGNAPQMETEGDSLQHALQVFMQKGLVNKKNPNIAIPIFQATGYATIKKTVDEYKKMLALGMPVFTGWNKHCFAIVGYNNKTQMLTAKNSYGSKWGKKGDGTFDISYNDISKLFTGYVIYDRKDLQMIFRDVSTASPQAEAIQWVLDQGLLRGYGNSENSKERFYRPDQPITRAEMAVVLKRLVETYQLKRYE